MAASYPTSAKTFPTRVNGTVVEEDYVNEPGDEITAVETDILAPWQTRAFNVAHFTSSAAGAWVVEAADVVSFAWKKIGKTVHLTFQIEGSSVGATPTGNLNIQLPTGITIARFGLGIVYIGEGAVKTYGFVDAIIVGGNQIRIFKSNLAGFVANQVNTLTVRGAITFEAQA